MTKKKAVKKPAKRKAKDYPPFPPHPCVWVSFCCSCQNPILADLDKNTAKGSACHLCENDAIPRVAHPYVIYEGRAKVPNTLSTV